MDTRELLIRLGVTEPALSEIDSTDYDEVIAWLRYIRTQDGLIRPIGYLITQLKAGHPAPPLPAETWPFETDPFAHVMEY